MPSSFRAIALNEDVKGLEAPKSPYKKINRKFIAIRHLSIKSGIDLIDPIISVQVIPSPKERAELEIILAFPSSTLNPGINSIEKKRVFKRGTFLSNW